ncbi:site-specific integrase [Aquimarina sp. 2201CG1-2-11]|uniref:site-specific integrase n=1 Tax=Aquimarina discodermiae TaxID=3231043 RepID=UPI0034624ACE
MENFRKQLIKKGYTDKTIKDFLMRIRLFDRWLTNNSLTYKTFTYHKLLEYIGALQEQGKSKNSINNTLRTLEYYYNYLKLPNIALNVRQRGVQVEQPLLLTEEELSAIYTNYQEPLEKGYFRYTNRLLLSLMIHQAIDKPELYRLELKDINLEKGTIYIAAGSRRKNSRIVNLQAHQIIPLHKYITKHRAINHSLQTGNPKESTKLFSPNCDKEHRLNDQLKILIKTIKDQNPQINILRLSQLKQSRIGIWIGQYGLRKAQYLSGYKAINAVERYKGMDMQDLTLQIEKFHPLQ